MRMSEKEQEIPDVLEGMQVQTPFKKGLYISFIVVLLSGFSTLWLSHAAIQKRLDDCHLEQTAKMERLKNEQLQQMREQERRIAEIEEKYRQILFNVSEAKREVRNKLKAR